MEQPFPSSPVRPPRFSVSVYRDGMFAASFSFYAAYAARHFLDDFQEEEEYHEVGQYRLESPDGRFVLKSDGLPELVAHRMTAEERKWQLPTPYPKTIMQIKTGVYGTRDEAEAAPRKPVQAPVVTKAPKPARTPKPERTGLVSAIEIAQQMKLEPREVRNALRKSGEAKPDAGWAWPTSEVDRIKKVIQSQL